MWFSVWQYLTLTTIWPCGVKFELLTFFETVALNFFDCWTLNVLGIGNCDYFQVMESIFYLWGNNTPPDLINPKLKRNAHVLKLVQFALGSKEMILSDISTFCDDFMDHWLWKINFHSYTIKCASSIVLNQSFNAMFSVDEHGHSTCDLFCRFVYLSVPPPTAMLIFEPFYFFIPILYNSML